MLWFADIAGAIDPSTPQVINDSKTPSGRVHVGALRGVLLHDALFRALRARGVPVRYWFGVDDYDLRQSRLRSPAIARLMERFPHNLVNGAGVKRKRAGQAEAVMDPSFVVAVP